MKTKHKRAVVRIIVLVAVLVFALSVNALAAVRGHQGYFLNGFGSYSCLTAETNAYTTVRPVGSFVYTSATVSTEYKYRDPYNPVGGGSFALGHDFSSFAAAKGYTSTATTNDQDAKNGTRIPRIWDAFASTSNHNCTVNNEYGDWESTDKHTSTEN